MSKITQKILSLLSRNKKVFFFGFILGFFLLLSPSRTAFAAWYDFLIGAVTFIPMVTIALILVLMVLVSSLLAAFSGVVLNWVLGPNFINWSYTNPATNPIIQIGLGITQPLVNMILVLVLVFIALATILRLAGYEIKKLLPTFILVALLVNFAPVISGLIVDASNIAMNFFTKEITGGAQLISSLKSVGDTILAGISWETFKVTKQAEAVLTLLVLFFVNIALFLVLLLFAGVFMVRYLAIWVLVILSPLAFACYILPATRKFWNLWWSQFIQWSIIGITMGFFLYLADQFAALNPVVAATGLGGAILPTLLPLVFLFLGFAVGLQTGAMGAAATISITKRSGKWVGTKVGRGVKTWAEEKTRFREGVGKAVQAVERVPVARWFIPEKARKYAEFRPAITEQEQALSAYSSKEIAHRIRTGDIYGVKAIGGMRNLLERGDMQDFFNAMKEKYKVATEEQLFQVKEFREKTGRLLQVALRGGLHQSILRGDPRLARLAPEAGIPGYIENEVTKQPMTETEAVQKAVSEARRPHIAHWEREVVEDRNVIEGGMERGREFWEAIDTQVKRGQETTLKTIDTLFSEFIDAKNLAHTTSANISTAWNEFRNDFKTRHQGRDVYFEYVESDWAKKRGWRSGDYLTQAQRQPTTPPTPGAAAGVCLAENTLIDTPSGTIAVQKLQKGAAVWTLNSSGVRVPARVLETVRTPVSSTHQLIHLILNDGRELFVSPGHPTGDGRTIADISVGDSLDERCVTTVEIIPYQRGFTYDILPSGETGLYWANGILIGSTLFRTDHAIGIIKAATKEKLISIK